MLKLFFLRFDWIGNDEFFDVKRSGFQTLTINASAFYKIELVAPGNSSKKHQGVQIIGSFPLKRGQKITAVLGQQGSSHLCGSGGSFVVLESDEGPKPLLIAGGAGCAEYDKEFGRGNIKQAAIGNENVGTSGTQKTIFYEWSNIYCAGAGFNKAPEVSTLAEGCMAPKSYKDGLTGGKGVWDGDMVEGGFGGGGASFKKKGFNKFYYGAGGGLTGGSTKVDRMWCWGGGGGSYSADLNAKFDHKYVEYGYCKISSK